jgi:hypothetical protein
MLIPASSSALQAGAARASLVPETVVGVPMIGYTDGYSMPADGLHDSLYARVLVLDDGVTRVALASLDLLGLNVNLTPGPGRLAGLLRDQGLTGWLVVSTHTHGGPRTLSLSEPWTSDRAWPTATAPYVTWVEDQVAEAVAQAAVRMRPVRLAAGRGRVDLSFNRRLVQPDGTVRMIWGSGWRGQDPTSLGPTDPEVGVVRLEDDQGRVVAVLFHYACHAVVLGSGNRRLTADFPGYAMRCIEDQVPGCTALFLQGAAGDLDPLIDVQNDFGPAQTQGEVLGREVVRVTESLVRGEGRLEAAPRLGWTLITATFPRFSDHQRSVPLELGLLQIGRYLALAGLPGEPFVDLQLTLKARAPLPFPLLLGYANGYAGYLPTVAASREGGYGADSGTTLHVQPGAGEALVDRAVQALLQEVWVQPLPDTLSNAGPARLQGALRPAVLPEPQGPEAMAVDLSQLGGPSLLPLSPREDGVWALDHLLQLDAVSGEREITVLVRNAQGQYQPYCRWPLVVLPGSDLPLLGPESATGWSTSGEGGARWSGTVELDGRRAASLLVQPVDTGSPADLWRADLSATIAVDLAGYRALRFWVHPGSAIPEGWSSLGLYLNGVAVDLAPWIDLTRPGWQPVEIELAPLLTALGPSLSRLRWWGKARGTLYLSGVELVAASPATGPTAVTRTDATNEELLTEPLLLLRPNRPNPFNGTTLIPVVLAAPTEVEVAVHGPTGQRVATLLQGLQPAGEHLCRWDGRDDAGRVVASGVYLCRARAGDQVETRPLLLVR